MDCLQQAAEAEATCSVDTRPQHQIGRHREGCRKQHEEESSRGHDALSPPAHVAGDSCRNTRNNRVVGDVVGHDCAGANQRAFSDNDARQNRRIAPYRRSILDSCPNEVPILLALKATLSCHSHGIDVIDEHHSMADEYTVFDIDSFANETVAGDFAILSN
jgi:hypothetical protein